MSDAPGPGPTDAGAVSADPEASDLRLSRRYAAGVVAVVTVIVLTCVAFLVPVPYVTMKPGPVFNTLGEFNGEPMLVVDASIATYPTSGTLDFTTVSVTSADGKVTFIDAIKAYLDDDVNVVPRSLLYPDGTSAETSRQESAAMLDSSKDHAKVAALRALGYEVPQTTVVAAVSEDGAAADVLETGDVLLAVDGVAVSSPQEAVDLIAALAPGDEVRLTVERGDSAKDFTVTTRPAPDDPDVPRVGVSLGSHFDFPFEISNNVGEQVGGPSAGSMFALAIYDLLTPGELTGGLRVAGTGEITPEGAIGSIGGVRQKMAGAAADDVDVFLVPTGNCGTAASGTDFGMTLIEVKTLDDAIAALEALAADSNAEVSTCG